MKVLFISNNWADAHQQTRLHGLTQSGFIMTCLAVFRNYYPVKYPLLPISLGEIAHAHYAKRSRIYWRLFIQLWKNADYNDCVYVYGFDLLLTTVIYKTFSRQKIRIIYEIPDIRELFFAENIAGKLIRKIEQIIIPHIDQLVVTSPEFVSEYFTKHRKICVKHYLVIENKVHSGQLPEDTFVNTPMNCFNRKIRIGYFGVLRCKNSLNCLISLAEKNQFEIILRGIFMPDTSPFEEKIKNSRNIFYYGPYQVPEHLRMIYNKVDIVWGAYPFSKNETGNHLWARTNRFYESLFFKKPIILQKGTADADKARQLGSIALEIDMKNEDQVIRDLSTMITPDYLKSASALMHDITENHYQITTEYKNLVRCLQQKKS
ncbi:hypothetical protein [Dyadobacter sp. LHD-138]|uniref:hypothetical protein n=1 Tax=Dyadobacter sp. LHD-138 TaxID=3071413 RepID=UPI0027E1F4E1|nr:hypothetical protein [Dyadobacter sp. LHD-138]MDQ6477578.1 hypothetical protein [Dyadobacter sp. LHD-138]